MVEAIEIFIKQMNDMAQKLKCTIQRLKILQA